MVEGLVGHYKEFTLNEVRNKQRVMLNRGKLLGLGEKKKNEMIWLKD